MTIPEEAHALVNGERQQIYGTPFDNWTLTASLITEALSYKLKEPLTAEDCLQAMICVKQARLKHTPDHHDSIVDICGYERCIELVKQERERRSHPPKG